MEKLKTLRELFRCMSANTPLDALEGIYYFLEDATEAFDSAVAEIDQLRADYEALEVSA